MRVLGVTSHFDAEAFFGSVIVATFRTADPANMKKFLGRLSLVNRSKAATAGTKALLEPEWQSRNNNRRGHRSRPVRLKNYAPGVRINVERRSAP